ncbi:MAG TPA: transposase [Saprospiraceae bacterium]|nr:transposase [Saprospiraceae bacterium]
MTTGYQIYNPANAYYLTFTVVDWVDVFTRKVYRDIILDCFSYCRANKGLQVWAYVIMTNHIHCILSAKNNNLSDVLRDFKRHTASTMLKTIQTPQESRRDWMIKRFEFAARSNVRNNQHQFWMHDNHAEELITAGFMNQKLNYIHSNPVRAGFVENASEWLYSSASNYLNLPSLIEIDVADI